MDYFYLRSQQPCVICVKFLSAIFIMLSFYIFKGYEEMLLQNSAKLFRIQLNRVFQPFMQLLDDLQFFNKLSVMYVDLSQSLKFSRSLVDY